VKDIGYVIVISIQSGFLLPAQQFAALIL